ncbi:sensor histidine kinase [Dyadobacter tibetensis]|uniref:sensor histidine kinase n=1 Tax=Dyadobacter tibetensis TaxID=1211851 RepID=UPI00046F407D|nr:sensor histidine kinase [Dyadobacter tibetensis]
MTLKASQLNPMNIPPVPLHIGFWIGVTLFLTVVYGTALPGFWLTLGIMCLFVPIHAAYYYSLANFIFPKYLFKGRYVHFLIGLLCSFALSTLLFRAMEIWIANPIIYAKLKSQDPGLIIDKLELAPWDQFKSSSAMLNAFEQVNFIVWITLAIKFFNMWYQKQKAALEAELNLLKGQLHPHFLFNTLNNLYSLTLSQSPQSPAVVMGLSEILRYMLYEASHDVVLLKRDIEILENYITLEKIRYQDRLQLQFSINGLEANQEIVPLLLLPLVENAFKHGVSEKVGEAWINIDLKVKDSRLKFKISNNKGEKKTLKSEIDSLAKDSGKQIGHIGLANIRKRLEILYPSAFQFKIIDEEELYAVILEIELSKRLNIEVI